MKEERLKLIPQKNKDCKNYYKELYAKKFETLDEIDKFLEKHRDI